MSFRIADSVYLQVANFVCRKILLQEWKAGSRVPSAHDLAMQLEVNPVSASKALEYLAGNAVIDTAGNISTQAIDKARALMKEHFLRSELPMLAEKMKLLNITVSELSSVLEAQSGKTGTT